MRLRSFLTTVLILGLAGSAEAAVKFYNSDADNGTAGDFLNIATNLCPPTQTTAALLQGYSEIEDNGLGTVTMNNISITIATLIDQTADAAAQQSGVEL